MLSAFRGILNGEAQRRASLEAQRLLVARAKNFPRVRIEPTNGPVFKQTSAAAPHQPLDLDYVLRNITILTVN